MDGILPVKSMIVEGLDSSNPASIMKSTLDVIAGDIFEMSTAGRLPIRVH